MVVLEKKYQDFIQIANRFLTSSLKKMAVTQNFPFFCIIILSSIFSKSIKLKMDLTYPCNGKQLAGVEDFYTGCFYLYFRKDIM